MSEWKQVVRRDTDNSTFAFKIFENQKGDFIFEITVDGNLVADGDMSESEARSWM